MTNSKSLIHNFFFPDHIVHPPFRDKEPWETPNPPAKGYIIRSDKGVFNLYRKTEDGTEARVPYEYITLQQYIQDKNIMCNMMSDGPL